MRIGIDVDGVLTNVEQLSMIIPIICYDTNYNRNCNGKDIYRCYSWYDVYKKIKEVNLNY